MSQKLENNEYGQFYKNYIDLATADNSLQSLKVAHVETLDLLENLTEEQGDYRYAEGKWSIKELLQHIIDCERVFMYRALSFARADETELPGFDQDEWMKHVEVASRSLNELANEFMVLRKSTISQFESFNPEMLMRIGQANGSPLSVRAIGFIIAGHERHHINVIKERYL